jgi:hypothetical protein
LRSVFSSLILQHSPSPPPPPPSLFSFLNQVPDLITFIRHSWFMPDIHQPEYSIVNSLYPTYVISENMGRSINLRSLLVKEFIFNIQRIMNYATPFRVENSSDLYVDLFHFCQVEILVSLIFGIIHKMRLIRYRQLCLCAYGNRVIGQRLMFGNLIRI